MTNRKRFSMAAKINYAVWMLALDSMSEEASAASKEPYPEDGEFACHWWNEIYDGTQARGWYWVMAVRDNDEPLLSY